MPDKMMPGPVQDAACIREAVCIHTKKIYDSCKEEDIASYKRLIHPGRPAYPPPDPHWTPGTPPSWSARPG